MSTPDPSLQPGLRFEARQIVTEAQTVPQVELDWAGFSDMPPVFATAMMVGFIEQTCVLAVHPLLPAGQGTVGTHVDVSHVAATPVGMAVTASIELVEVDARSLLFKVQCHDEAGLIGEGMHRRAIIHVEKFLARVGEKARQQGDGREA
jgi:fluoroacetyl-CoA thioesterase